MDATRAPRSAAGRQAFLNSVFAFCAFLFGCRPAGWGAAAVRRRWPQRAAGDADPVTVRAAGHPLRHKANESRRDVYGIPARE